MSAPTSPLKTLTRWLWRIAIALVVVVVLLIGAVFALRTWLLPDLTVLQPRIEAVLSEKLKQPVRLSGMRAAWNWASADLQADDVSLGSEQAPVLGLKNLDARVQLHPLLLGELRTDFIRVTSAQLLAQQTGTPAAPLWTVAGIDMAKPSDGAGLRNLLKQTEVRIDALQISVHDDAAHWVPEKSTRIELAQIQLNNDATSHRLKAQFAPSFTDSRLGKDLQLTAAFSHAWLSDTANWRNWTGYAKLQVPNAQLMPSIAWGLGMVNTAANEPVKANEIAQWRRWAQQSKRSVVANSDARLDFKQGKLSALGTLVLLGLSASESAAKPSLAPLSWSWQGSSDLGHLLAASTDFIALPPVIAFAQTAPLPTAIASALSQASAKGTLKTIQTELFWDKNGMQRATFNSQAEQLGLASFDWQGKKGLVNVPSIEGISGRMNVVHTPAETRSNIQLDSRNAWANLPRLLQEPRVQFDTLKGNIEVVLTAKDTRLKVSKLQLKNADIDGSLSGEYSIATRRSSDDKQLGLAQFTGDFARADLAQLHRYMPLTMSDKGREWLRHTIAQGEARDLTFTLNGELARFPFLPEVAQAGERFDLQTTVNRARLNFNPLSVANDSYSATSSAKSWPLIEEVTGSLRLQGLSMSLQNMEGTIQVSEAGAASARLPIPVRMPKLSIASLTAPVVVFQTRASAPAASVLTLVRSTPLSQTLGDQLAAIKTNAGEVSVEANLTLDIAQPANNRTQGRLALQKVAIELSRDLPPLDNINASLAFKQGRVAVEHATGNWLGGDVALSGALDTQNPEESLRVQGTAQLAVVQQYSPSAMWQALLTKAKGALDYNLVLRVKPDGWHYAVNADLSNTALQWSGLFNKAAGMPLAFNLSRTPKVEPVTAANSSTSTQTQETWDVQLGDSLLGPFKANIERVLSQQTWRVTRGALALGAGAELNAPDTGLGLHIASGKVNLDALRSELAALPWGEANVSLNANAQPTTNQPNQPIYQKTLPAALATNEIPAWMPSVLVVNVDDLTVFGRHFLNVAGAAVRNTWSKTAGQEWSANLSAQGINGYVNWTDAHQQKGLGEGQLVVRLAQLTIPPSEIESTSKQLLTLAPAQVPSIDLVIEQLMVGDKPLGAIAIKASNRALSSPELGWDIESLRVTQPHAEITGSGRWTQAMLSPTSQVALQLKLSSDSLGDTLDALSFGKILAGSPADINADVRWNGTPFNVDLASLNGSIDAKLGRGQFLKIDPGSGRLVGLFSLQSLPRRLTLDFKDMFGAGFAYDSVATSASIKQGVVELDSFVMSSASAEVLASGSISLLGETQALRFTVKPNINAGSVSLLYMLINPPIGLMTLAAQWLLSEPLRKQLTLEYDITGSWAKPDVKQVKRAVQ